MSRQQPTPSDAVLPRAVLAAVPWPAYAFDTGGNLEWWNDGLVEATGYRDEELAELSVAELLATDDPLELLTATDAVGNWRELDAALVTRDGSELDYRHVVAAAAGSDGGVTELVGLAYPVGAGAVDGDAQPARPLVELLREASERLAAAATHGEVETVACEVLASTYDAAWIGHCGEDGVVPTVAAGTDIEAAEVQVATWATTGTGSPATRAIAEGRTVVVTGAETTHAVVPIATHESTEGVLVVTTTRETVDATERRALEAVAAVLGLAAAQARTERLVLSEPAVELEFHLADPSIPLVHLVREAGATGQLAWMRREPDGDVTQFFELHGVDPDTVVSTFESGDRIVSCRPVDGDSSLFEVRFDRSAAGELLAVGATVRDISTTPEGVRLTAITPTEIDVRAVVDRLESVYPTVELVAKRRLDAPGGSGGGWEADATLTERQHEALAVAFAAGYFEWPRDATAEEVAEELGVSAATFHYHLRQAERALVTSFLERE